MPTLQQRNVLILPPQSGAVYLLRDEFLTAAAAPLSSTRTCEPGPLTLTLVQNDGSMGVSGGKLQISAQATPVILDLGYYETNGIARAIGRVAIYRLTMPSSGQFVIAWNSGAMVGWSNNNNAMGMLSSSGALTVAETNQGTGIGGTTLSASTEYTFAFAVRATGGYLLIKGGVFTDWTLLWVYNSNTSATLRPALSTSTATAFEQEYLRVTTLGGIFASEYGPASVNVASPASLTEYAATANQVVELSITAPAVLANECGIRYRITDANNYWRAYFDSSGAFRVDSVSAGVATNRINVAGVIAGGQTRIIRIVCDGSTHDAFTQATTTWTKRGSTLNVSHQNSSVNVAADIGTGWTAADLRSYPRSGIYGLLDGV